MITGVSEQVPTIPASKTSSVQDAFAVPEAKNVVADTKLSKEQQAKVDSLKKTDQEVRAHEQAHKNVGGQYAGSASFSYHVGPDGKRYAVGGEVPIDIAPIEGDPEATLAKLDVVIAAALAPAQPSAQDRKVAAIAVAARNQARAELLEKNKEENGLSVQPKTTFDVNDFGTVPNPSVTKAYADSNDLGQSNEKTGRNISFTS
ncbi:MAG: SprA-related family protein [Kordiimonadaceae bacterium]|jgi:hypothetical protein|nr:SprA-related family protein [Kordiimonadaceae bacterium]MBT6033553.1 SprA-related family protein [Kordiimonadaceae bacterium]